MSELAEEEALTEVLRVADDDALVTYDETARAILASDWLAAYVAARTADLSARVAQAWDEGALRAAPELGANGSVWLIRNNPHRSDGRMEPCAELGEHPIGKHALMAAAKRALDCRTCHGWDPVSGLRRRETAGLVCQSCGWDFGTNGEPAAALAPLDRTGEV